MDVDGLPILSWQDGPGFQTEVRVLNQPLFFVRNKVGALLLHYSWKQSMYVQEVMKTKKGRLYYSNYRSINYSPFVPVLIEYHEGLV